MLPDLLAEKTPGNWTVYIANVTHGFVPKELLKRNPLSFPHSGAFINLLEDYAAGSALTSLLYCFVCIVDIYLLCFNSFDMVQSSSEKV